MGKKRLEEIKTKFPERALQGNLNPNSHDIIFEYERAQRIVTKSKKIKTKVLRNIRRQLKKLKKTQQRKLDHYHRIHGFVLLFGYWKRWFEEGKIGSEDDSEPNLLRPQSS